MRPGAPDPGTDHPSAAASVRPGAATARRAAEARLSPAFVLFAAVFVLAVLGGFFESRRIVTGFADEVEARARWAERHRRMLSLRALVAAIEAPGDGVFESGAPGPEAERLFAARREFDRAMDQVRADLARTEGLLAGEALASLGLVADRVNDMQRQAQTLFARYAAGDIPGAARRMASMARAHAEALAALDALDDRLHRAGIESIERDRERAHELIFTQVFFAALLVVLTVLVYAYSVWLNRKQAERSRWNFEAAARVADSESRLRAVLDGVVDAIVTVDGEGRIESLNAAAERLFGYEPGELDGRSIGLLISGAADEPPRRALDRLVGTRGGEAPPRTPQAAGAGGDPAGASGAYGREFEGSRRDGTRVPLEAGVADIEGPLGVRFVAIFRDLTERRRHTGELRRAKELAEQAAVAKARFLANMSHEIRTPLNGVVGMTGLLLDTELDDEQRDYATTARTAGESLLTIVNDILDFSKIEAGKLDLETIDFELRTVVEESVELLAERAQGKGLEIVAILAPDAPDVVAGDPGRVRQILLNLVGNAIKFTEKGEVVVRLTIDGVSDKHVVVRCAVSDTGIGIEKESLGRLFSPFTQEDGSMTRKYGGTGLGLAIAHELARLMGGSCGASSEKGKGSTFWFTARLEKRTQAAVSTAMRRAAAGRDVDIAGVRALVVDDSATNRGILVQDLTAMRVEAQAVPNADLALAALREAHARGAPYDVAIVDVVLEGADGFALAHELKGDDAISGVDIVLLTSFGQRGHASQRLQAGIAAYLTKPVRRAHLRECLSLVVERRRTGAVPGESTISRRFGRQISLVPRAGAAGERVKVRGRVLVAEDNPVNQKVASRTLEKLGWRADVAANGREAVDAALAISYDIVFMDCQMPEMDGFEATAEIRRREPALGRRTPIVAVTANAMKGDRERCLAAGMDDHVAKPFVVGELRQALDRWSLRSSTAARAAGGGSVGGLASGGVSGGAGSATAGASEFGSASGSHSAMEAPLFETLREAQEGGESIPAARQEPTPRRRLLGAKPPPAGPAPRLDLSVIERLRALVGGPDDPDVIAELVATFLDHLPETISEMRLARETGDSETLERAAHSLKSSARSLGAMRAGDLCEVIESEAGAGLLEGAGPRIDALDAELSAAAEALRRVAGIPAAGAFSREGREGVSSSRAEDSPPRS